MMEHDVAPEASENNSERGDEGANDALVVDPAFLS
jgi:hypothetical protein